MKIGTDKGGPDMSDYIFRKASQSELDKCTDLANLAFGFDFRTLLPKVYGEKPVMEAVNFVADNGEFKGFVSVLPERLTVGNTVLKTGYVGSVCVHPDSRGQGIMIKLMDLANNDMRDNGTDIAFLNGNRQRYEYYGFVPAGVTYTFNIHGDNWAHALKNISADGVTFEEIHPGTDLEKKAKALYHSKHVHFERTEFAELCRSYYRTPYAVLDNGEFIGYIVTNGDKNCWTEICVASTEHLDMAIKAWMPTHQVWGLQIFLPEWERELRRRLACYAAGMGRGYSVQAQIFRFRRVAEAYLRVKAQTCGLSDGRMAFDIDGERFEITVKDNEVAVCDGGDDPLKLSAFEANRLMLTPMEYEGMPETPQGWFPLGVYVAPDSPDAY